ncbi:hsp70-binding protein 1-like [Limulus polyphemus]|uniref:Hsp70-binding protein 1-like n=1 Tax=Limulus polyphemus TaxID=6850 RepID=A0ABM1B4L7_LIMPO|nr:hsp70-binding protein 1-like [Limulus polyphemus]XP_013774727.1 hsp70-binding protein 1-like [Limulus polyphemus]
MSEGEDRRHPRNLQGLLRFCTENTEAEDSTRPTDASLIDPERREWLEQALESMTVSVVEEMEKCLQILRNGINDEKADDDVFAEQKVALEKLLNFVDSIDHAIDFHKLGGFSVLQSLLREPDTEVKALTAELVAELVQNNPYCQKVAIEHHLVVTLLNVLDHDPDELVKVKALYAISCLCRQCSEAQQVMEKTDGFSVLLRALQSPAEKLKIKTCFLLSNLCSQEPAFRELLFKMGFVEQLAAILQTEHNRSHEHLMSALLALVSEHEQAQEECHRPELGLKNLLENRLKLLEGKEEFQEELYYCQQLLNLCFNQSLEQPLER